MIFRKIRVIQKARGIKNCFRVTFHPAAGNWRQTSTNTQQCILKRQQDDTQSSSTRKLERSGESASSASSRQLERGEDIPIGRSKMEFHNMQISDHRYLEKVFKNVRKKLNLAEVAPALGVEALKTNVLIWGLLMSTTTKAAVHLGPNYVENLEVFRNTNFEELQNLIDITQKLIFDHPVEVLNVTTIEHLHHGRDLHLRTTTWLPGRKQTCTSTQIPSSVSKICRIIQKGMEYGKITLKNFDCPILTEE